MDCERQGGQGSLAGQGTETLQKSLLCQEKACGLSACFTVGQSLRYGGDDVVGKGRGDAILLRVAGKIAIMPRMA